MKDENQKPAEETTKKLIEVAKEKITELDDDQLEKLAGGAVDLEAGTGQGACSCQNHSC
ncbi:class I lanthipeptide [Dyadobacter beijingensis]|uniref:class I lanthipeptide n=1 Tax=Dyadobacter beijingensis TaxID=365489 RepID=UPI00036095AA|nr:class I lanthipeptide [Dyadobacter beijingensis]